MNSELKTPIRGDATRDALLVAATHCFARDGFHAVSLREIARTAMVNQALIGYHFRNKEGLYLAVFEHVVSQIRERLDPLTEQIEGLLSDAEQSPSDAIFQNCCLNALLNLIDGMVGLMADDRSASWSLLIMREQQAPTAAFSVLYESFMSHVLKLLTRLVQRLRSPLSSEEARLIVITIMGQVLVFRFARAGLLRHLQWERIGEHELAAIRARVRRNITHLLMTGG
ncbi:MAG: CerR family C-terminal domain-containing protein [Gammaproteobacteria bacterium]